MARNNFKILDSDMHLMEPIDLWERYIDAKFKREAPLGLTSENVRDLSWPIPMGDSGASRRPMEDATPIKGRTFVKTKGSTALAQNGDGRRKFNWRP
ncbi:MAG TPA: hypothetical protein VN966_04715 [Candidatus Bathyarchaeia archaeon]|nr:hypothetical protein [Candidatus Bathyarchaeia archaeon]